jgi:PAS domain S-box-containing protein
MDSTTEKRDLMILVVDDIQENLDLLEEILSEKGFDVVGAPNGEQALTILKTQMIHIIIADAMMPKMDGFQLCKEVKAVAKWNTIPFIIYTGNYVDEEEKRFAQTIGVDRYVVKYAGLGLLLDALEELVEQHYSHKNKTEVTSEHIDDQVFLQKHHAMIVKKLEEKMKELESSANALAQKNKEIEASEAHYRSFFEHASIAIVVLNPDDGKILEVNNRCCELLQYSEKELLSMRELPFVEPEKITSRLLCVNSFISIETRMLVKDGDTIEVDIGAGLTIIPRGSRITVYIRDITEQKRIRERLLQTEKMSLMGRLAGGIAHEIRNPLAAIRLNLQYFMMKNDLETTQKEAIEAALEGAQRIDQIVDNTLGLARQTPPHMRPESINEIMKKSIWFLRISAQQKNLTFDGALAEGLPDVMADPKQIQQVMLNIIQNAIDAAPPNTKITIDTTCSHCNGQADQDSKIFVTIRDRGPGMSKEMLQHLFEPFYTTKQGGTGLGLMLSKQILEKHSAEISYEAADGGGLMAKIIFPTHLLIQEDIYGER